jgi:hypothetical protein
LRIRANVCDLESDDTIGYGSVGVLGNPVQGASTSSASASRPPPVRSVPAAAPIVDRELSTGPSTSIPLGQSASITFLDPPGARDDVENVHAGPGIAASALPVQYVSPAKLQDPANLSERSPAEITGTHLHLIGATRHVRHT